MNRRNLNAILIVSLVVIWSIVGYRFLNNKGDKSANNQTQTVVQYQATGIEKKQLFPYVKATRDPFLDVYFSTKKSKVVITKKSNPKTKKEVPWPKIEFYGFVKNENHKNALALIKIDGITKRVRKGSKYNGFIITTIYKDSVIVKQGNEYRSFSRQ